MIRSKTQQDVGWAKAPLGAVPTTILISDVDDLVGTLRFAHPTNLYRQLG
jgi:hypothetical protein